MRRGANGWLAPGFELVLRMPRQDLKNKLLQTHVERS